ncbi:type III-D CRISPR-associated protein Csx19 [Paenibacillus sp. SYP-B4298]|uniref:type III-D CRISPR-associated protein Csx19 n=1 Tax=Paenibacillus sp. SYP-B4298 TaxID=2996034 RepID=UPI0022DE5DC8|nr:CRISPR-associated protein Csx19 [Paenibacillus sp. SYP-B4298]
MSTLTFQTCKDNTTLSWLCEEEEVWGKAASVLEQAQNVYAYAMLDHAVCFGTWTSGQLVLGLDGRPAPLQSLRYVQELRLFHAEGEFKAVRMEAGEKFRCRYRLDQPVEEQGKQLHIMDEQHKLWGACRKGTDEMGWSLLESGRGTKLYIPMALPEHGEAAVQVRHYIQMNQLNPGTDVESENDSIPLNRNKPGTGGEFDESVNPFQYVDERLVTFAVWTQKGGEG